VRIPSLALNQQCDVRDSSRLVLLRRCVFSYQTSQRRIGGGRRGYCEAGRQASFPSVGERRTDALSVPPARRGEASERAVPRRWDRLERGLELACASSQFANQRSQPSLHFSPRGIVLLEGVIVFGGFPGATTDLITEQIPSSHLTRLHFI